MINQITFEGYLVRAWIHSPYRYLRLANQRPPERGGQTDGRASVESDYVTVRLDPSLPFDMYRATPGLHLLVRGRVEGRDIPETLGEIVAHCEQHIALPLEIASIQVARPAVQIYCTTLEFRHSRAPDAVRLNPNRTRRAQQMQASSERAVSTSQTLAPGGATAAPHVPSQPAPDGRRSGKDSKEFASLIEAESLNETAPTAEETRSSSEEKLEKKGLFAVAGKKASGKEGKTKKK
jgi:hypothetical protein